MFFRETCFIELRVLKAAPLRSKLRVIKGRFSVLRGSVQASSLDQVHQFLQHIKQNFNNGLFTAGCRLLKSFWAKRNTRQNNTNLYYCASGQLELPFVFCIWSLRLFKNGKTTTVAFFEEMHVARRSVCPFKFLNILLDQIKSCFALSHHHTKLYVAHCL